MALDDSMSIKSDYLDYDDRNADSFFSHGGDELSSQCLDGDDCRSKFGFYSQVEHRDDDSNPPEQSGEHSSSTRSNSQVGSETKVRFSEVLLEESADQAAGAQPMAPVECISLAPLATSGKSRALIGAAARGQASEVQRLLKDPRFTSVRESKRKDSEKLLATALFKAVAHGHLDVLEQLRASPLLCDLQAQNDKGWTTLHEATLKGHRSLAERLLADADFKDSKDERGATALHVASARGHVEIVELLVGNPRCHLVGRDDNGCTALHLAALQGHCSIAQHLLAADRFEAVEARTDKGASAMHMAALKGHAELVHLLIASPRVQYQLNSKEMNARTCLHWAAEHGHVSVVELFLGHVGFTEVESKTKSGQTALELALERGYSDVASLLRARQSVTADVKCKMQQKSKFKFGR